MITKKCLVLALVLNASVCYAAPKLGDANFPKPSPSRRHEQKVAAIKSGDYDLVMIGDSFTHVVGEYGGKYKPLKAVWAKYYAPKKAINLGYSGYRTENILWNLQNGELEFKKSPKLFVVEIGSNNAGYGRMCPPEEIVAGVKAIVETIQKRHPSSNILVLRPFPKATLDQKKEATSPPIFAFSQEVVDSSRRAGELMKNLADDKKVFYLDLYKVFLRDDGKVDTKLLPDLAHPNAAGAEVWAKAMEPTIKKLMKGD